MGSRPKFIRVEKADGAWWFVQPDGKRFLSIGVDMVNHGASPGKWDPKNPSYSALRSYGSARKWEDDAIARLHRWGFNTIAAWSDDSLYKRGAMPFAVCLHLGSSAGVPWVDMWDPEIKKNIEGWASEWTARWKDDPLLIGYFTDNETGWWDETLFMYHMGLPARYKEGGTNRTKTRIVEMMRAQYGGSIERFREDWSVPPTRTDKEKDADGNEREIKAVQSVKTFDDLLPPVVILRRIGRRPRVIDTFMEAMYDRYGEVVSQALRKADPNHLVLGERFHQWFHPAQAKMGGKWDDVLSTNLGVWALDGWVSPNWVASMERLGGRPVLVGEFYFSAMENASGCRNSNGGFPTVATQKERAAGYAFQVRQMAAMPQMVGWHWFQYFDEAPLGRGDGEDYNMGLVDINNREYSAMVKASIAINKEAPHLHANARPFSVHVPGRAPSFRVPAAARAPVIDGQVLDWDKAATWVPELGGRPWNAPLGDIFVSRTPGYLHVAVMYQYAYRDPTCVEPLPKGAPWPDEECEIMTMALARPDGAPIATLKWRWEPGQAEWKLAEVKGVDRPKFSGGGRNFEVSIPVPDMKELKFTALIRSWADSQVIYWGARPLHEAPNPSSWGTLLLQ